MQVKKYDKYKLEKKRILFFQIGFILSLLMVLLAFEFITVKEKSAAKIDMIELDFEVQTIQIIRKENIEMPEPKPEIYKILNIIDNNSEEIKPNQIAKITDKRSFSKLEIGSYEEEVISFSDIQFFSRKPIFKPRICKTKEESEKEILKFIKKTIKYPQFARENNIQGKVYVKFLINKKGILKSATVLNKTNKILEKEALRIINKLDNWKAGIQNGKMVDMWYTIPIVFQLE